MSEDQFLRRTFRSQKKTSTARRVDRGCQKFLHASTDAWATQHVSAHADPHAVTLPYCCSVYANKVMILFRTRTFPWESAQKRHSAQLPTRHTPTLNPTLSD